MASSSNKATITKGLRLRLMDRETQAREMEKNAGMVAGAGH